MCSIARELADGPTHLQAIAKEGFHMGWRHSIEEATEFEIQNVMKTVAASALPEDPEEVPVRRAQKQQGAGHAARLGAIREGLGRLMKTAYDLVWIAAERTPHHLALVDDRTERKFTYRQLLEEVDVGRGRARRARRPAGSRVATVLPNLFEHCIALLALQRLGAVPALMNSRLQPAELAKLVAQGEIEGAIMRKDDPLAQAIAGAVLQAACC